MDQDLLFLFALDLDNIKNLFPPFDKIYVTINQTTDPYDILLEVFCVLSELKLGIWDHQD